MENNLYIGVDLHKTQFTICVLNKDGDSFEVGTKFPMNKDGYDEFSRKIKKLELEQKTEKTILAIESTSNARFFRDKMVEQGFEVTVVNTLRFKVINLSTKKPIKTMQKLLLNFWQGIFFPKVIYVHQNQKVYEEY